MFTYLSGQSVVVNRLSTVTSSKAVLFQRLIITVVAIFSLLKAECELLKRLIILPFLYTVPFSFSEQSGVALSVDRDQKSNLCGEECPSTLSTIFLLTISVLMSERDGIFEVEQKSCLCGEKQTLCSTTIFQGTEDAAVHADANRPDAERNTSSVPMALRDRDRSQYLCGERTLPSVPQISKAFQKRFYETY